MMDKYIGFDIDSKKTVACVVQQGRKEAYATFPTGGPDMRRYLHAQRQDGCRLHRTFEIRGEAGYWCDALRDDVDALTVSNPSKMTWIYRTPRNRIASTPANRRSC